jgi:hypothetical protein
MNTIVRRAPIAMWSICFLVLGGALAYGQVHAGEDPGDVYDIATYLRLHDEATRISAGEAVSGSRSGAETCVRRAEQPRPPERELRG